MAREEELLRGRLERDEQQVGRRRGDRLDHVLLALGAEIAVVAPGDLDPRVEVADLGLGAGEHLGARTQEVDAEALAARQVEQRVHEVDPGHALGQGTAEEPRRPDDHLAVRGRELAAVDRVPQLLVALVLHELRRVDGDVLDRVAPDHGGLHARNGLGHRHRVHGTAEKIDARIVVSGHGRGW